MSDSARWEWRTVGVDLDSLSGRLASFTPEHKDKRSDWYLVSVCSMDNFKVSDTHLSVKIQLRISPDGIEQWQKLLKLPFPISYTDVALTFKLMHLPLPYLAKDSYDRDSFLQDLVYPEAGLKAVRVDKIRQRYSLVGAQVEFTRFKIDDYPLESLGVESHDIDAVRQVCSEFGTASWPMIDYVKAIKRHKGDTSILS